MKARLIGCTEVVEGLEDFNTDLTDIKDLIAFCARVSNPSNQYNFETSDKLINYLLAHKHFSPFEMVNALVEVETTRDIARQLLRHRSFTFQEFSQRYADPTQSLDFTPSIPRYQDTKNRQNSVHLNMEDLHDREIYNEWIDKQQKLLAVVQETYHWAIINKIAKEVARKVLPEGLTGSRMYVNGTIRSWIHYIDVRTEEGVQHEHRELARAIAQAIQQKFGMIEQFNHYNEWCIE